MKEKKIEEEIIKLARLARAIIRKYYSMFESYQVIRLEDGSFLAIASVRAQSSSFILYGYETQLWPSIQYGNKICAEIEYPAYPLVAAITKMIFVIKKFENVPQMTPAEKI